MNDGNGMVMSIRPGESPCYRCLLSEMPAPGSSPTCDTAGVLNTIVALVAGLQCTEALKILTGHIDELLDGLMTVDVWSNRFQNFRVRRQDDCPTCGRREFPYLEAKGSGAAATLCGRNAVQVSPGGSVSLDLSELEKRLSPLGKTTRNEYLVRSLIDGLEITVFPDGRAIVKGTSEPSRARAVVAKYVGA